MLKKRIIANISISDGIVVQSFGFQKKLPLGRPEAFVKNLDRWMVDEIRKRRPDITIIFGGPECNERNYNFKKSEGVDYYFIGESEQTILDFLTYSFYHSF